MTEDKQTEDKKVRLARLVNDRRVHFDLNSTPEEWPPSHSGLYSKIQGIASVRYQQYREEAEQDSERASWKLETSKEAKLLVKSVLECIQERQNEAGWRAKLESRIFDHFTYGLSCGTCGFRLWRAWQDPPETDHELLAQDHDRRRPHRMECRCARERERTLSKLFSDRTGEYLVKDKTLEEVHLQQGPDRVYGLKQSAETATMLSRKYVSKDPASAANGKSLSDAFQTTPFGKGDVHPLLFPFLVVEWKSEKAGCSFSDIQNQTALPIRRMLQLQHRLRSAARTQQSKVLKPLVWFLAIRGDDVRVYGAHVEHVDEENQSPEYRVTCLLDCRISHVDGALQLLLLVDFLYEWARDNYTPMLVHQLKVLSGDEPDLMSFHAGTNATTVQRYRRENLEGSKLSPAPAPPGSVSAYGRFEAPVDTKVGVVRNAQTVLYRVRRIVIDSASFETIFKMIARPRKTRTRTRSSNAGTDDVRKLAKKIVALFRVPGHGVPDDRFLANNRMLANLEQMWLSGQGHRPEDVLMEPLAGNSGRLWVRLQYVTYISHDWEIVRELSYVAATETALRGITRLAGVKTPPRSAPEGIAHDTLERLLTKIRTSCIKHNLAAAISRSAIGIGQAIREDEMAGPTAQPKSIWDDDVKLKVGLSGLAHEVVLKVLEYLSTSPSTISDGFWCRDQKTEMTETSIPIDAWPVDVPQLFEATPGCVLVRAKGQTTQASKHLREQQPPDYCVFFLERGNFGARFGHDLEMAIKTWAIHRSCRRDTPNLGGGFGGGSDRNMSKDFSKAHEGDALDVLKEQIEAASALGQWLKDLGTPITDELNIPKESFRLKASALSKYDVYMEKNNSGKEKRLKLFAKMKRWRERMQSAVIKNRKKRGFSAKEMGRVWLCDIQVTKADSTGDDMDIVWGDESGPVGQLDDGPAAQQGGHRDSPVDLTMDSDTDSLRSV